MTNFHIAFLDLGAMGSRMVSHLVKAVIRINLFAKDMAFSLSTAIGKPDWP